MQRRREQLARRQPPEVKATSATKVALVLLLAAWWMSSTASLETTTDPPKTSTEVVDGTDLSIPQCKCFNDSSLNCSFRSLNNITEDLNSCSENISKIDVSHNQLESLDGINIEFGSEFNVSHNLITEVHSRSLKSFMEVLDVSWNNVLTLEVEDMGSLRILNASHNRLERVQALPKSCDLEVLDVSSNLLVELPEGIRECRKLSVLNVSNNTLKVFPGAVFEDFLQEGIPGQRALTVDLRGNDVPPNDESLRGLVDNGKLNFSTQPVNCACANLSRGHAILTLCLSTMCANGKEYWTSVNGTALMSVPTLFLSDDDTAPQTESTGESDRDAKTVPSDGMKDATVPDETTTVIITSTEINPTTPVPPMVSLDFAPAADPPGKPRVQGDATRGGRAEGSQPDVALSATIPPRDTPPPPTDTPTPAPDPGPEGRKRRRIWVTLALTLVVLGAAGLGVYVLVKLYRRRQRQLLEERSQRIPLQPLVATPRSLRAPDDDFVP